MPLENDSASQPGDSPAETGLEFFTDEQLWDELARRFDGLLLVGEKGRSRSQVGYLCFWHGSAITGLGLADYARLKLQSHIAELEVDDT